MQFLWLNYLLVSIFLYKVLQPHHRFGYEGDVVGCLAYLHVFRFAL